MGLLINTLYSASEDCQPGTSSYTSRVNENILSPGKDDSDATSCSEEIALSMVVVTIKLLSVEEWEDI